MSSGSSAIGALIIVPIFIAVSAAYIALKTHSFFQSLARHCCQIWKEKSLWSRRRAIQSRKQKLSDLASSQGFADSWCDLESLHSTYHTPNQGYSTFIGQSSGRSRSYSEGDERSIYYDTPTRIWHPTRSSRLMWSFANPKSQDRDLFELSSVARPSPVIPPTTYSEIVP